MGQGARIVVCNGPDRGRTFPVSESVVHVGRGVENHVVLGDPEVLEHHVSVICRAGQCAVAASTSGAVVINGQPLDADQWVAIDTPARLQLSVETAVEISTDEDATRETVILDPAEGSSSVAKRRPAPSAKAKKKARSTGPRQVAKFITDRPGDPLVRLGTDGRLPELSLNEATAAQREQRRERNPWILYAVLGGSMIFSTLLLLIDPQGSAPRSDSQETARHSLSYFYKGEEEKLQPYQKLLRRAVLAHAQKDFKDERRLYFRVLDLLDAADIRDPANLNGLTGKQTGRGRSSDADLRKLIETLVAR